MRWLLPGGQDVLHFPKGKGDDPGGSSPERIHAMEYVARVLSQIPEPRKHQVRYYGYYSCAARGKRLKDPLRSQEGSTSVHPNEPDPPPQTAALRKRWADLLRRIYEVDPLVCPRCSAQMRVVSFITQPAVIRRILDHMRRTPRPATRPPPTAPRPVLATPSRHATVSLIETCGFEPSRKLEARSTDQICGTGRLDIGPTGHETASSGFASWATGHRQDASEIDLPIPYPSIPCRGSSASWRIRVRARS